MKHLVATLVVLAALALPLAGADTATGSEYGLNGGCYDVGLWDVYFWGASGGAATLSLTWDRLPVISADYDLMVYRQGALDDGALTQDELLASSEHHGSGPAAESVSFSNLPGGTYVVAVVPYQAEGESYSLSAPGWLQYATYTPTPGVEAYENCLI